MAFLAYVRCKRPLTSFRDLKGRVPVLDATDLGFQRLKGRKDLETKRRTDTNSQRPRDPQTQNFTKIQRPLDLETLKSLLNVIENEDLAFESRNDVRGLSDVTGEFYTAHKPILFPLASSLGTTQW